MNERLQHDPRTKQQIKDVLFALLYGPVEQHFKRQLAAIITQNSVLMNTSYQCFSYRGVVYSVDAPPILRKMTRLHPSMQSKMDIYISETKQLNDYELPYVLGFINQVLNYSNNLQDYLKVLPESVHGPIQQFIATCPCRVIDITPNEAENLVVNNKLPITLIKQRMLANLLL